MAETDHAVTIIQGKEIKLLPPRNLARATSIVFAAVHNEWMALAAALAACWAGPGRPKARYEGAGLNPIRFGEAVWNELAERGVPAAEILAGGAIAMQLLHPMVITAKEVEEAEDFTEAGQEVLPG